MADTKYPTLQPELIASDIRVRIWPDEFAQYTGTRAQLEAEGLIPKDFEWPRVAADAHWEAEVLDYGLRRVRPDDFRGPMRGWLVLDNWQVRVSVVGRDRAWHDRRDIERQRDELTEAIYRQTPSGRYQWEKDWGIYWKAREDKAFQQFKALVVPERKKPGRPAKRASVQAAE